MAYLDGKLFIHQLSLANSFPSEIDTVLCGKNSASQFKKQQKRALPETMLFFYVN